ncbi:MAG: L,D-transpeptidase family protein, partial [Methylococcales bacterium]|nr:L,D-transpeptidase family protein [Methylococcales bacterium]
MDNKNKSHMASQIEYHFIRLTKYRYPSPRPVARRSLTACACLLSALTACQTTPPQTENWAYQPPSRHWHTQPHLHPHPQASQREPAHPIAPAPDMRELPGNEPVVGQLYRFTPRSSDTIPDIARHYDLGYQQLVDANPSVDPWLLRDDETLILPDQFILPDAPHTGLILNLASMRLYYFPQDANGPVWTFPVGIGRDHWETPLGLTKIVEKIVHPDWIPTPSIIKEHLAMNDPLPSVVKSGPDNPLGDYALMLGFKNYLIHGTDKPYGIGMQVSHGCIRLYPEDIAPLCAKVAVGTEVRILHQPYLAAWFRNRLYIQAYAPLEKWAGGKAA